MFAIVAAVGCRDAANQVSITNVITLGQLQPYDFENEPPHVALELVFSPKGDAVLVRRRNGALERWRLDEPKMELVGEGVTAFGVSASGERLAVVNANGRARLKSGLDDDGEDLGATPDVEHIVVSDLGDVAVNSGNNRIQFLGTTLSVETKLPVRNGLAISADGRVVAAATGRYTDGVGHRGVIEVRQLDGGIETIHDDEGTIFGMWQLHIANNRLATTTQRGDQSGIVVWDLASGERIFSRERFESYWVRALAITDDGRLLLSGDEPGWLRLWDIERDELLFELKADLPIQSTAISKDQKKIAWGSWDATIQVAELTGLATGR